MQDLDHTDHSEQVRQLLTDLARLLDQPDLEQAVSATDSLTLELRLDDVDFILGYAPVMDPHQWHVIARMGPLQGPQREPRMQHLLELNLMLCAQGASLALEPAQPDHAPDVLLLYRLPVLWLDAPALLDCLRQATPWIARWRAAGGWPEPHLGVDAGMHAWAWDLGGQRA